MSFWTHGTCMLETLYTSLNHFRTLFYLLLERRAAPAAACALCRASRIPPSTPPSRSTRIPSWAHGGCWEQAECPEGSILHSVLVALETWRVWHCFLLRGCAGLPAPAARALVESSLAAIEPFKRRLGYK